MANSIEPGFLTPSAAARLVGGLGKAEWARRQLEDFFLSLPDEFPAKLTSMNALTLAFAWTRQSYDADMQRIDDPNPLSGTSTWMPAFAYGDGILPPIAFPVETVLRKRGMRALGDLVWEFPWSCSCGGAGTGTGTAGGVTTACCPSNAIARTLYATITVTGGSCPALDGQVFTLTYDTPLSSKWYGYKDIGGHRYFVIVECSGTDWLIEFTTSWATCHLAPASYVAASATCHPFSITSGNYTATVVCCPGVTLTVTVTE